VNAKVKMSYVSNAGICGSVCYVMKLKRLTGHEHRINNDEVYLEVIRV